MHRDVKPANVLIAGEPRLPERLRASRACGDADTRITDSDDWVGTVDFMAPEHLEGEPTDARTDVYALGCVLYTALTGAPPFRRDTVPATITAHLHEPPPRPSETPGVPRGVRRRVARALAKDPADRYPSAGDLGPRRAAPPRSGARRRRRAAAWPGDAGARDPDGDPSRADAAG